MKLHEILGVASCFIFFSMVIVVRRNLETFPWVRSFDKEHGSGLQVWDSGHGVPHSSRLSMRSCDYTSRFLEVGRNTIMRLSECTPWRGSIGEREGDRERATTEHGLDKTASASCAMTILANIITLRDFLFQN